MNMHLKGCFWFKLNEKVCCMQNYISNNSLLVQYLCVRTRTMPLKKTQTNHKTNIEFTNYTNYRYPFLKQPSHRFIVSILLTWHTYVRYITFSIMLSILRAVTAVSFDVVCCLKKLSLRYLKIYECVYMYDTSLNTWSVIYNSYMLIKMMLIMYAIAKSNLYFMNPT